MYVRVYVRMKVRVKKAEMKRDGKYLISLILLINQQVDVREREIVYKSSEIEYWLQNKSKTDLIFD